MPLRPHLIPSVLLAWCITIGAVAQEIQFNAQVDRTSISTGEYVKCTISLTNSRDRFEAPSFGGLVVVQGPFDNSSFTIVNGRMSGSTSRTWVLTATAPGKYTIGAARTRVGNGIIETEPITIEVTKGAGQHTDPSASQGQSRDPNLFITISVSKNKAYVGEQIVATYMLYSRYNSLETTKSDMPKLEGFWAENVELGETNWDPQLSTVNGLQYRTATLKKQVLLPQRPGKLRIAPFTMECVVNRSFFNRGSEVSIRSNPVEITVSALPPGAPPDFNGAVGELDMTVAVDRTQVKANEAIELTVMYSGKGNLKLMEAPALNLPGDLEMYDPKLTDKLNLSGGGMSGSRTYQFLIIPRHEGDFPLPPITFSYFDTRSNGYRTITGPSVTLEVSPGDGSTAAVQRPNRSDVQVLGKDIRYLRTGDLELRPKGAHLFGSAIWLTGMGAPLLGFLLFLGWWRRREAALNDTAGTRRKQADRVAREHLNEAAQALKNSDRNTFYTALGRSVHGYLGDKFGWGPAEITAVNIRSRLGAFPQGASLADELVDLLEACDMARYAPVEDRPRQQLYDSAAALIGRTEQIVRA
jgi:hypothetical protein